MDVVRTLKSDFLFPICFFSFLSSFLSYLFWCVSGCSAASQADENEEEDDDPHFKRLCAGMSLSICYAACCGGIATVTGTGPNLIVKGFTDKWVVRLSLLLRQWYCYCDRTQHGCHRLHCEIIIVDVTITITTAITIYFIHPCPVYYHCWDNGNATLTGHSMAVTGFTVRLSLWLRQWYCYCDRTQHGSHGIHWWVSTHVVLVAETMVLSLWLAQPPKSCFCWISLGLS